MEFENSENFLMIMDIQIHNRHRVPMIIFPFSVIYSFHRFLDSSTDLQKKVFSSTIESVPLNEMYSLDVLIQLVEILQSK